MPASIAVLTAIVAVAFAVPVAEESTLEHRDTAHENRADATTVRMIDPITVDLDPVRGLPEALSLQFTINDAPLTVDVVRTPIRDAASMIMIDRGSSLELVEDIPSCSYRGRIRDREDSMVALSVRHGGIVGWLRISEETQYFIEPSGKGTGSHVIYAGSTRPGGTLCTLPEQKHRPPTDPEGGLAGSGSSGKIMRLCIDTDQELHELNGSSIEETVWDIESVINVASAVYESDVDLRIILSAVIIRTDASPPYQGDTALDLLCNLTDIWNQPQYTSVRRFDAVQLMTGRDLEGPIGTAFVSSTCSDPVMACNEISTFWSTSVVETRYSQVFDFRVALTAHEIGHGLGATHCNGSSCHIMCPAIGQCGGTSGSNLVFGTGSRLAIGAHLANASCLPVDEDPLVVPFEDDFESAELDPDKWLLSVNSGSSYFGQGEPSGSRSLVLHVEDTPNGDGSVADIPAIATTRTLDIANHLDGTVTFWAQHYDYQNDDNELTVEYLDEDGFWKLLLRITPAQASQTTFREFSAEIPEDGYWEGFHLRFKADLNQEGFEFWAIDLLKIDAVPRTTPGHDDCDSPEDLEYGIMAVSTLDATDSPADPTGLCSDGISSDVWYRFQAECDGRIRVTSCGLVDFELVMAAYLVPDGCADGPRTPTACSSDEASYCISTDGTELMMMASAGEEILLRVGSLDGTTGSGVLFTECTPMEPPSCPADLNSDGMIDGEDLSILLGAWNTPGADIDSDGNSDGSDLAILLGTWGTCNEG